METPQCVSNIVVENNGDPCGIRTRDLQDENLMS